MAPVIINGMQLSAPCRIVQMACEVAGVEYEFKSLDLFKGENMTPEYLAKNPQHNIPFVEDGDLGLTESRAAAAYVVSKYAKDDSIYPKDLAIRAKVDSRMYFDMGAFYKAMADVKYPEMGFTPNPATEKDHNKLKEVLGWVDDWVKDGFAAGTAQMTLADICLLATYSTMKEVGIDLAPYKNLEAWAAKCIALVPNYQKANGEGAVAFGAFFKSKQ